MKLEQLYKFFLFNFFIKSKFYYFMFTKYVRFLTVDNFFFWKISNYADNYWFLYSNKKSLYEIRYTV